MPWAYSWDHSCWDLKSCPGLNPGQLCIRQMPSWLSYLSSPKPPRLQTTSGQILRDFGGAKSYCVCPGSMLGPMKQDSSTMKLLDVCIYIYLKQTFLGGNYA